MFEICEQFLVQLINCMPVLLGVYIIFDFIGSLLFGRR